MLALVRTFGLSPLVEVAIRRHERFTLALYQRRSKLLALGLVQRTGYMLAAMHNRCYVSAHRLDLLLALSLRSLKGKRLMLPCFQVLRKLLPCLAMHHPRVFRRGLYRLLLDRHTVIWQRGIRDATLQILRQHLVLSMVEIFDGLGLEQFLLCHTCLSLLLKLALFLRRLPHDTMVLTEKVFFLCGIQLFGQLLAGGLVEIMLTIIVNDTLLCARLLGLVRRSMHAATGEVWRRRQKKL
mmetsp:Transcript_95555/g.139569  ORF Transcript_95555/g.139569 Transcript_95555/m.139569 type:complete len:239 (+) Transcript_95555:746-1462(+)